MSSKPNEVEVFLAVVEKMIQKKIEEKPKSGIKISPECKMKYTEMLEVHNKLRNFLHYTCEIGNYNICKECDSYLENHPECNSGKCQNHLRNRYNRAAVSGYFTCFANTSTRWDGKEFEKVEIGK